MRIEGRKAFEDEDAWTMKQHAGWLTSMLLAWGETKAGFWRLTDGRKISR